MSLNNHKNEQNKQIEMAKIRSTKKMRALFFRNTFIKSRSFIHDVKKVKTRPEKIIFQIISPPTRFEVLSHSTAHASFSSAEKGRRLLVLFFLSSRCVNLILIWSRNRLCQRRQGIGAGRGRRLCT